MMKELVRIIDVTDDFGKNLSNEWLEKSESVHRLLRPQLPKDYLTKMQRVFSDGGCMSIAVVDSSVVGIAVYRIYENTASGIHMYVDDLVTDEQSRSSGVGNLLMAHMQKIAQIRDCEHFTLDSGTQRQQAHKFYFREGMVIAAFHFAKPLRAI